MSEEIEKIYGKRKERYKTAMLNGKPDRVPLRIFAAEFSVKYAGYSIQEATYDYEVAFKSVRKCAKDFKWDSTNVNMIYIWGGIVDAFGQKYYRLPGLNLPVDKGFQYVEPRDEKTTFMHENEYDLFIENPTEFLVNVWMPRISKYVVSTEESNTYMNNMAWLKGGLALMKYNQDLGNAGGLLRTECGCVPAIHGILKAPFDIIADKLRGFRQVCIDVHRQPKKVEAACEAVTPHLLQNALITSDPEKILPVTIWLHRGTLFSQKMYERFFWPTTKEIIKELWKKGIQTLWYAEGDWSKWLKHTAELPEKSIIYHVDKEDIFEVKKQVRDKFAISGGIPNDLLAFGTPQDVKDYCKKVLKVVGKDGGYIMDSGAIMMSDAKPENVMAMTEAVMEYGVY